MFFTTADLQHRLPVAPSSYDGRTCSGRSFGIGEDIPDGAEFTAIVSIAQQWDDGLVVAYVYRGANGHFFFDRIAPNGRVRGEIIRIQRGLEARAVTVCVPRVHRRP